MRVVGRVTAGKVISFFQPRNMLAETTDLIGQTPFNAVEEVALS